MQGIVGEDHGASQVHKLPLHAFHESMDARFTTFAGWSMPVSYGSSVEEHLACRHKAAVFDVSHMGEIEVDGSDAAKFLDFLLTNNLSSAIVGQAIYSPLCAPDGGTIDDLIAYRKGENSFMLCVNAANIERDLLHLTDYSNAFDCKVSNVSSDFGLLAIQGPKASDILKSIVYEDLSSLGKMRFLQTETFESMAFLSRSGYTGEDGFEVYCRPEALLSWAKAIDEFGKEHGMKWGGLAARDSLRLEAGFPLHGHELSSKVTPLQAGLGWSIDWDKPNGFVGLDALLQEKHEGTSGRVGHYIAEDRRIPRDGASISFRGKAAGKVLSGGYSPCLERPIGTAWISGEFWLLRHEEGWTAEVRGKSIGVSFEKPALRRWRSDS